MNETINLSDGSSLEVSVLTSLFSFARRLGMDGEADHKIAGLLALESEEGYSEIPSMRSAVR